MEILGLPISETFASSLPPQALEQLDLASLLRIAEQNWYDIVKPKGQKLVSKLL